MPRTANSVDTIILGCGAQFILKGRPDTYHVLLVAALTDRIHFPEEIYQLNCTEATAEVAGKATAV